MRLEQQGSKPRLTPSNSLYYVYRLYKCILWKDVFVVINTSIIIYLRIFVFILLYSVYVYGDYSSLNCLDIE